MPEGPSIVILKNLCKPFKGKKIISVEGNTKIGKERLAGKKITEFKSWGKHFLICFKDFTARIHFLMFGSYRINEERELAPRLSLHFQNGQLNFYSCSVKFIEDDPDEVYDWTVDVMSRRWNPASALKKIKTSSSPVCDLLLDQNIFSGVGNIIKNEVLFRIKVHPLTPAENLPTKKLKELVAEARIYSFDFLKWKKKYVLRKHWLVHTKKTCVRCKIPLKKEYLGKTNRRTFFCNNCQVLY